MIQQYRHLPHKHLSNGTRVSNNNRSATSKISLDDAALLIMTDFDYIQPFLISPTATIDEINQRMIACGVRLLFVSESNNVLLGLVTYNDIFGEKPVRYLQEHGGQRDEITTREIMTSLNQLEALQHSDILKASIGDILKTIQSSGRQHLLVVDDESHTITGLFSSTQMEKQLGIKIDLFPRAVTFSDMERAIND